MWIFTIRAGLNNEASTRKKHSFQVAGQRFPPDVPWPAGLLSQWHDIKFGEKSSTLVERDAGNAHASRLRW